MRKTTWLILMIFALLLAFGIYKLKKPFERGIERLSLAQIQPDLLTRITMTGAEPVDLIRDGKIWRLNDGRLADAVYVQRLLDALPKIASSDQVTADKDRYAEFNVSDDKGTTLKAYQGQKLVADFVIGTGNNKLLVRSGKQVFRVNNIAPSALVHKSDAWIEHKLLDAEPSDVTRLEVQLKGEKPYVLIRDGDNWKMVDPTLLPPGFRFDPNATRNLIASLMALRAQSFADKEPGEATDIFKITTQDKTYELQLLGDAGNNTRYARVVGSKDTAVLPEASVKNILKTPFDFRDLSLMTFDIDKINRLEIVSGKTKLSFSKDPEWKIAQSTEAQPKDFEFDPANVAQRLNALLNAKATGITIEPKLVPKASVTATDLDGQKYTLSFGDVKEGKVLVQGNADKAIYVAGEWLKNNLVGGLETFRKHAGSSGGLDANNLSNLPPEIRSQIMQQIMQKQRQTRDMRDTPTVANQPQP
jgi:hypothetical protein